MRTPRQIIGDDAYSQLVFEGYEVVPIKPTQEIEDAHFKAHAEAKTVFADFTDLWRAMISAANSK
ncbi:hypothetical protein [Roseibium album]|uniref:hypothetical protein n=1 Tax=Roseibium album TaxID=311410 RepID=UPI002490DFE3|nr:hypothetical protein [Roseibium album]